MDLINEIEEKLKTLNVQYIEYPTYVDYYIKENKIFCKFIVAINYIIDEFYKNVNVNDNLGFKQIYIFKDFIRDKIYHSYDNDGIYFRAFIDFNLNKRYCLNDKTIK